MASAQTTQLLSALQSSELATKAPSVYQVIRQLILSVDSLSLDVSVVRSVIETSIGMTGFAANVTDFSYSFTQYNILLSWTALGTGHVYEIREGTNWDTANYITSSLTATVPLDPRVTGTYYFLVKTIDSYGRYSETPASLTVVVPVIGSLSATYTTITNSVILYWTKPNSAFAIDHYEIWRGTTKLGELYGTFFAFFESVGGTYEYTIIAVDIIGNESPNDYSITIPVGNPNDFVLLASSTDTAFAGSKTNAYLGSEGLIVPVNTTQTWSQHFSTHSWDSPLAQINAGYPYYIQPTESSAAYVRIVDFGAVVHNTSASASYTMMPVVGTVNVTMTLEASTDGSTYGTPVTGNTGFFSSVRYLRITLTFTPVSAGHDFAVLTSLSCNLNVQLEQDGGNIEALSTDSGGTLVTFNKAFLDVISITVAALSTDPTYCVYDFVDVPNPTSFKVLVFNSSGTRVSKTVSWKVRGVL